MKVYNPFTGLTTTSAPVAQLDRALPSGGKGQGFESLRARQPSLVHSNLAGTCYGVMSEVAFMKRKRDQTAPIFTKIPKIKFSKNWA